MAWTAPMTAVADSVFTAAQFNTYIRDNLNETAVAKATAEGRIIMTAGANQLAEREILDDVVSSTDTTTSTSYTNLAHGGPEVTMTTGSKVFIWINANAANSTDANCYASVAVSGASDISAIDGRAVISGVGSGLNVRACASTLLAVTAGENTFTMKYRVQSGTGTFTDRRMQVMSL